MNCIPISIAALSLAVVLTGGCATPQATAESTDRIPEYLTIREDGSMWFRDRPMAERDVIIYSDGQGGEKAAIRVHVEPLHPDFFRDTIIVVRE